MTNSSIAGLPPTALPPTTLTEQLHWPITAGTVPTRAPAASITMRDIPVAVQDMFQPRPVFDNVQTLSPPPDLAGDDSVICTDPEWVTYWQRQGIYDQICHTESALWQVLVKLQPLTKQWRIDCEGLRQHIVNLYQEKARTIQALRELMINSTRWQQRAVYLEQQLQKIARQIQINFPAHANHGLSSKLSDKWEALYPNLDQATQKIIDELKHCYAQLHGPNNANVQMDILKRDLELLRVQTRDYDNEYDILRGKLHNALDIIRALVNQLIDKGYSLRAIDKYLDPQGQADIAEIFSNPKRFEFAAVVPPTEQPILEQSTLRADMDKLTEDMNQIKTLSQQRGQHARHPFSQRDVWYNVPSGYNAQWNVSHYCDEFANKERCMRECLHVCDNTCEPCDRQCRDVCHLYKPCMTP